ncbi:Ig-like domain-containing protein [Clostridium kluyveri]|uniref:BIG2 domain-containing protein n=1 Tax=Clostridium kluyveri TaxID=1534 RepID=A0A1L5FED1_CLOKL|nr:Ig-like domain-containing protein [Clostridium kluyveri]APM41180.1 hypothetical protein BS101_03200 [Clostridium kluyveri]
MNTLLNFYNVAIKRMGKTCVVNGINIVGIFKEIEDKNSVDTKCFITATNIKQGDIIEYNNMKYLIINKNENINDVYNVYVIRKCPYNINFNIGGSINVVTGYIETKMFDVNYSKTIILPGGTIIVTVPLNGITSRIKINHTFIKMGAVWRIVGCDLSVEGLIKFTAEQDQISPSDDMENEITGGGKFYNYVMVSIPKNININVAITQQITTTITRDGNILSNPIITYSSDNTSVAIVNSNGIVSGISQGICNIKVTFEGDSQICTKVIPVTINAVVAKTVKSSTDYDDIGEVTKQIKLLQGDTTNISVYAYENNLKQSDTFTFSFSGCDSTYYINNIIDGNNFSIKNVKGSGNQYLTVTAISDVDSSIVGNIQIRLAGEW